MTLKILLVDDEALARMRLKTLLGDCHAPSAQVVAEAANTVRAVEALQHHAIDAVLADIHMPGADGLTLAQALKNRTPPVSVVFVTAYAEHAVQAFELEAVDYLTKPVRLDRLQSALQKIERTMQARQALEPHLMDDFLIIQEHGNSLRVALSEVLYLKAELKYITVRTASHSYLLEGSLGDMEERYGTRFMRIHRNALVARSAVRALKKHHHPEEGEGWAVRLTGIDEALWVSRRQIPNVRMLLSSV